MFFFKPFFLARISLEFFFIVFLVVQHRLSIIISFRVSKWVKKCHVFVYSLEKKRTLILNFLFFSVSFRNLFHLNEHWKMFSFPFWSIILETFILSGFFVFVFPIHIAFIYFDFIQFILFDYNNNNINENLLISMTFACCWFCFCCFFVVLFYFITWIKYSSILSVGVCKSLVNVQNMHVNRIKYRRRKYHSCRFFFFSLINIFIHSFC